MAGPGTELKRLLKRIGLAPKKGCRCERHARLMDQKGPQWCERNRKTIIEWMQVEAAKRHMLFSKSAARGLLAVAIWRSRKSIRERNREMGVRRDNSP